MLPSGQVDPPLRTGWHSMSPANPYSILYSAYTGIT
jgi:hypothetical protein